MNLIQAYNEAKINDQIIYGSGEARLIIRRYCKTDNDAEFLEWLTMLSTIEFLDDDWQIERKPMVWEGRVSHNEHSELYKFLEGIFNKGVTKIRIEEIIDEAEDRS